MNNLPFWLEVTGLCLLALPPLIGGLIMIGTRSVGLKWKLTDSHYWAGRTSSNRPVAEVAPRRSGKPVQWKALAVTGTASSTAEAKRAAEKAFIEQQQS